ncbi:MAG: quinol:electron acceptor oxidoreductase subunit ActD [Planctomycetaceae bacterium]|nr:DUF3341 domain-containing protein [Planctomycetaceae bacterium]
MADTEAANLTYAQIDDDVLGAMKKPPAAYFAFLAVLATGVGVFFITWQYQIQVGMGVAGVSHPVGWGAYIGNFVFWVGIAHSGTFISAILHLLRSKWRDAVSRASEAMTIFAVMTAGLFPLIHLGRFWTFYYILPYPSQRQIWPDFLSPLVLDVLAITTYLIVSMIFFYVGMIPDLASARDRIAATSGANHWRARLYRIMALGWCGAASQWNHYGRAYLYFAALATPLVISVHSVVSWDFAVGILPGWHETIFPPYFVAGAIHSGLAMVLTLMIPLRRLLRLGRLVKVEHFESVAKTMIVTTLIVGYAYVIEPFIAWYGGNVFEKQWFWWVSTGERAPLYYLMIALNVLAPLTLVFRAARRNVLWLFILSLLVNAGMWIERYQIISAATAHDFLPHNWGWYSMTWVEIAITAGAFTLFLLFFTAFAKLLPVLPMTELKESVGHHKDRALGQPLPRDPGGRIAASACGVMAVFSRPDALLEALKHVRRNSTLKELEVFSPLKLGELSHALGLPHGPVRFWTLAGALLGLGGGFALAMGSAAVNNLIAGGKPPVMSIVPYCVVAFEGMILLGAIFNLLGMLFHARLKPGGRLPQVYDARFSRDRFGLFIACELERINQARSDLAATAPEELHVIR